MDRGSNGLEALAEEEDEEQWGANSDSEDDEQGDGGIKRGEPNKFDSLCDGVLGTLGIVHAAMNELLELKDELLKHSLPPNVLTKLALTTTKMFRSVTDMHMPCNELIRMVRIYSTPWEEKSAALKKLHEDYESKKAQLNIAIKRLQLIDAHTKRMAHDKRIMNWEKLFAKLTMARGHGRRWKFLIESFKKKAKAGPEELQKYIETMQGASDDEDDEDDEMDNIETQMALDPSEGVTEETSEKDDESSDEEDESKDMKSEIESELESSKLNDQSKADRLSVSPTTDKSDTNISNHLKSPEVPMFIRPPMKDKEVWTGEPEFDRFLHVRCYKPEGLNVKELRGVLTCGNQFYKTKVLDPPEEVQKKKEPEDDADTTPSPSPTESKKPGRGRLIGTRGGGKADVLTIKNSEKEPTEGPKLFDEAAFKMPDVDTRGIWVPINDKMDNPEHLKVAIHFGPREEMEAMATIDLDDLDSLDLPTAFMPSTVGDEIGPAKIETATSASSDAGDDVDSLKSVEIKSVKSEPPKEKESVFDPGPEINNMVPVNFPLYSLQTRGDAMHRPSGAIPIVAYWVKRSRPTAINRATEASSIRDICLDATGFDLDEVTKEDLHKEQVERCVSAMSLPVSERPTQTDEEFSQERQTGDGGSESQPEEETVLRKDYDRLKEIHMEEMEILQNEYEQRLQDLAEAMDQMSTLRLDSMPADRPISSSLSGRSPGVNNYREEPSPPSRHASSEPRAPIRIKSAAEEPVPKTRKPRPPVKPSPAWGQKIPKDFFERLKMFEDNSRRNREELNQRINREVSDMVERKLAGEFKLGGPTDEEEYNPLHDVSLPAVFMPNKTGRDLTIFNPRAAKYFHPSGSGGVRLTQPPSMLTLPPLPQKKINVVNMFDLGQHLNQGGGQSEIMMQRYLQQQQEASQGEVPEPYTPAPTFATATQIQESAAIRATTPVRRKEAIAD